MWCLCRHIGSHVLRHCNNPAVGVTEFVGHGKRGHLVFQPGHRGDGCVELWLSSCAMVREGVVEDERQRLRGVGDRKLHGREVVSPCAPTMRERR